jgi:hypothetical protein
MAQYLLPCSCGQKVRVDSAQAGGRATCACGQSLSVPTLRGLRALDEAPADKAAILRAAGRQWSPLQGILFSAGLFVFVVALGFVAYSFWNYVQATPYTRDFTPEISTELVRQVDDLSLTEAVDEFYEMRDKGLGQPTAPPWIHVQAFVDQQRTRMIAAAIAAAIGLLAVIASLCMKPARSAA